MYKIAVIGAGQLGSRHLQGLAKIDFPVAVSVVDPSTASLTLSHERFSQTPQRGNVVRIDFETSLGHLCGDIDLAILATTADVRAAATRELLDNTTVRNILFEKILFQAETDYDSIANLLERKKINAWVNCARRVFPFYLELRKVISDHERIVLTVQGGEWGLACNAIHFIDLIAFLSTEYEARFICDTLDKELIDSSRKNFVELTGTLQGRYSNGSEFYLHARRKSNAPHIMTILGESIELVIDEGAGTAKEMDLPAVNCEP